MKDDLNQLVKKLIGVNYNTTKAKVSIGFDGYTDLIQKVVLSNNGSNVNYYSSLEDIGRHIMATAGKSAQLELVTSITKAGGNAPIMANAMGALGVSNYCFGTMGVPEIHPVFKEMNSNCTLLSFGSPAQTNALEFDDGKLILSEVSTFENITLKKIIKEKGEGYFKEPFLQSEMIAMVDWCNMPACTTLWKEIHEFILKHQIKPSLFFFDIADPSKKSATEIKEVLQVISLFSNIGSTIFGMNENEVVKVYHALTGNDTPPASLEVAAQFIFDKMDVHKLLVHPTSYSFLVSKTGIIKREGKLIKFPKLLTGGGDNLNAGFCFGLLNGFTDEECLLIGMATSGAYVQNGYSPDIDELIAFLETE